MTLDQHKGVHDQNGQDAKNVVARLDSVRKYANKSEYRNINRIRCDEFGLEIVGDGSIVKRMASLLADENCDIMRGFEVRRGDTLCFKIIPINSWVNPPDRRPEHLRK